MFETFIQRNQYPMEDRLIAELFLAVSLANPDAFKSFNIDFDLDLEKERTCECILQ